jgi:hypothetical protein
LFQIVAAIDDAGVEEDGGFLQTATIALTLNPSPIRWARGIALSRPPGDGVP